MKIPTFEEAKQELIEKRGTPLDRFVAYWEPRDEDVKFREMLKELLEYATTTVVTTDPVVLHRDLHDVKRLYWNPSTGKYEEKQ